MSVEKCDETGRCLSVDRTSRVCWFRPVVSACSASKTKESQSFSPCSAPDQRQRQLTSQQAVPAWPVIGPVPNFLHPTRRNEAPGRETYSPQSTRSKNKQGLKESFLDSSDRITKLLLPVVNRYALLLSHPFLRKVNEQITKTSRPKTKTSETNSTNLVPSLHFPHCQRSTPKRSKAGPDLVWGICSVACCQVSYLTLRCYP